MKWRSMMKKRMSLTMTRKRRDLIQRKQAEEDHPEKRRNLLNRDAVTFKSLNGT
jgi:hypothetical protein